MAGARSEGGSRVNFISKRMNDVGRRSSALSALSVIRQHSGGGVERNEHSSLDDAAAASAPRILSRPPAPALSIAQQQLLPRMTHKPLLCI